MTEGRSNEPEDRLGESIHSEEQRKKKRLKRNELNFRDLKHNTKCINIHVMRVPEEEKRETNA